MGRSEVVKRVALLPVQTRKVLGADDYLTATIDAVVTLSAIVLEESEAPLLQRLFDAEHEIPNLRESGGWLPEAVQRISSPEITAWAKRLRHADHQKVLNRLLGTATFNLIRQDLDTDARTVLTAIRFVIRLSRPWALAMDDSLSMLTKSQRDEAGIPASLAASFFGLVLNVEELLGVVLSEEAGLSLPKAAAQYALSDEQVQGAMGQFRKLVRASADEDLSDLSEVFSRKMRGARDALASTVHGGSGDSWCK